MAEQRTYRPSDTAIPAGISRWSPHIGLSLFFVFLLIRLPLASEYPVNWDSVQYLLALNTFDLEGHQPHPPGYIGYIMLGRAAAFLVGDGHFGLVLLSVVSGAIAVATMYPLARCWLDKRFALITALLFGTSPLVWYYSDVALNYMVEAAVVIPLAWMSYRARTNRSWSDLLMATLLLSLLGALRQSGLVLLAPLWLYTAWGFPWRERIKATVVLGVTVLSWLVPLIWLSGGVMTYWNESRALGDLVSSNWAFVPKIQEYASYVGLVTLALLLSLAAALVVLVAYRSTALQIIRRLPKHDRRFFLLWATPSSLTYLFGHFGQPGYILTVLPIVFLLLGAVLSKLPTAHAPLRYAVPVGMAVLIMAVNSLAYFAVPEATMRLTQSNVVSETSQLPAYFRQYDISTSDDYWDQLIEDVAIFPPESTVVLTTIGGPRISGGYRHLSYYLDEYEVYGLGRDQRGAFGQLFEARGGVNNYSIHGLQSAQRILALPERVRYIVTPDPELIKQIPEELNPTRIEGTDLVFIRRPIGQNLAFLPGDSMVACDCPDALFTARLDDRQVAFVNSYDEDGT